MKAVRNLIFIFFASLLISGCANKVIPLGGPKDILPPVVLSVEPPQETTNITSGNIVITFDEYVQFKEIAKQLIISPVISPAPQINIRKKSIVIELPDSLAPNTTYTISFGNAIVDNNEGNILPGFRYVFSTGPLIDSLTVSGIIVNAETRKPEKDAIAMLYYSSVPDSVLMKVVPDYFARSTDDGSFVIRNVRAGNYRVFALTDKNLNFIFDLKDESVGFVQDPVDLKDSLNFQIAVSKQPLVKQAVKSNMAEEPAKFITVFARPLQNPDYRFLTNVPASVKTEYAAEKDTITFYCLPPNVDSLKIVWYENKVPFDTIFYKKSHSIIIKANEKIRPISYIAYPTAGSTLKAETNPVLKWSAPIVSYDTSLFMVTRDSLFFPVKVYFTDSLQTNQVAEGNYSTGKYLLTVLPNAITDMYGRVNDTIRIPFSVPDERTVGSISYKLNTYEKGNFILQLVNDKDEVLRQRLNDGKSNGVFEQVDPGVYKLRIIDDVNNNGKWDMGDFRNKLQPEPVQYNKETITVRANWEVEIEWFR